MIDVWQLYTHRNACFAGSLLLLSLAPIGLRAAERPPVSTRSQEAGVDERVVYAPDVVAVDRIFLIALKVPAGTTETRVSAPDSVALFDHTRPTPARPAGNERQEEVRRFYF